MTDHIYSQSKRRWLLTTLLVLMCYPLLGLSAQANQSNGHQSVTINQPNGTIGTVLKEIEAQTGLRFFYNNEELDTGKSCNIRVTNEPVDQVIKTILKDE